MSLLRLPSLQVTAVSDSRQGGLANVNSPRSNVGSRAVSLSVGFLPDSAGVFWTRAQRGLRRRVHAKVAMAPAKSTTADGSGTACSWVLKTYAPKARPAESPLSLSNE